MAGWWSRDFSRNEVDWLLRDSEGRTGVYWGDDKPGHADGLHHALTNAALNDRTGGVRNGELVSRTAFCSRAELVDAACELLNSIEGKWAREQFAQAPPQKDFPRGSHNGMKAKIHYDGQARRVRVNGEFTMLISSYFMAMTRDDSRQNGLHIVTFFPELRLKQPKFRVEINGRNRMQFSTWPPKPK